MNEEIQEFCRMNYGVTFPVLAKIDVNGDRTDPVYKFLKKNKSGLLGLSRVKYVPPENSLLIHLGGILYVVFK